MVNSICYFNGQYIYQEKCNIHISDLGLQRGYGVFDFFREQNGKVIWFDDYMNRLSNSIGKAGLNYELDKQEISKIIQNLQKKNNFRNSSFKIIITAGYSTNFTNVSSNTNLVILNNEFIAPGSNYYTQGAKLIAQYFSRMYPDIKSLNYFQPLRLREKLKKNNAIDILYYKKYITETSRSNIFLIKNKEIFTPKDNILRGITRKKVIEAIGSNYNVRIENIPFRAISEFDEIFITSTSKEVMPIIKINDKIISSGKVGPITKKIMKLFKQKIKNEF